MKIRASNSILRSQAEKFGCMSNVVVYNRVK